MEIDKKSLNIIIDFLGLDTEPIEEDINIIEDSSSSNEDFEDSSKNLIDFIADAVQDNQDALGEDFERTENIIEDALNNTIDLNSFLNNISILVYENIMLNILFDVCDLLENQINSVRDNTTITKFENVKNHIRNTDFDLAIDELKQVLEGIEIDVRRRNSRAENKKIEKAVNELSDEKKKCSDNLDRIKTLDEDDSEFQPSDLDNLQKSIQDYINQIEKIKKLSTKKNGKVKRVIAGVVAAGVAVTGVSIIKSLHKKEETIDTEDIVVEEPKDVPNNNNDNTKDEEPKSETKTEATVDTTVDIPEETVTIEDTTTTTESKVESTPVIVDTPSSEPIQVEETPKTDENDGQFRSTAERVYSNWSNLGANYSVDDIIEVIKVLNGYDSSISLSTADDIIIDVIDKAINPAMNNVLSGTSTPTYEVDIASLLIKNQSGIETVKRMQNNLNSMIKNPYNMDTVAVDTLTCEGVLLGGNDVSGLSLNQSNREVIILWSRLAIGANALIGLGDYVAYVDDEAYTVDNSYVFEDVISNAINQGKSY